MTPPWYHNYAIYIFGSIHLALAIWMVVEYFATTWPHFRNYRIQEAYAKMKRYLEKKLPKILQQKALCKKLLTKNEISDSQQFQIKGYQVDYISFEPIYIIFFLICSILSLGLQGYFYCFCLFYIFLKFPTLSTVLNALKRSGK